MALRDRLRRLEEAAEGQMLVIPQRDGTIRKFPQSAGEEAFTNLMDRLGTGEDAPPEHPLIAAARNSSEIRWSSPSYAVEDPQAHVVPIVDLSEP